MALQVYSKWCVIMRLSATLIHVSFEVECRSAALGYSSVVLECPGTTVTYSRRMIGCVSLKVKGWSPPVELLSATRWHSNR